MAYCEMCGKNVDSLTTIKTLQAELDVCSDCEDMGTVIDTDPTVDSTETKHSNGSSSELPEKSEEISTESSSSIDLNTLRADYGDVLREARENRDKSLSELASELNKKESHLRQIEQENRQPTEQLQNELEHFFNIELSIESDWNDFEEKKESSGQTLGDVADFDL